ncbi:MAG TPA: hypothetical protein VF621_12920 [Pyrinomonadaceae bacterium]
MDNVRDVSPEGLKGLKILNEAGNRGHMKLSPGGRFLVMTDDRTRTLLFDLSGRRGAVVLLDTPATPTFSPDDRYIGVVAQGTLHVFAANGAEGAIEIALIEHTGYVTAIAFSDDGKYVATHDADEKEGNFLNVWLLRPEDLLAEAEARVKSLRVPRR